VVPWALYFENRMGTLSEALSPDALWAALWPILLGGVLALALRRWTLPSLPEGDIVVVGERAARASLTLGAALERADTVLRQWPVACLSLLLVVIILGTLLLAGR